MAFFVVANHTIRFSCLELLLESMGQCSTAIGDFFELRRSIYNTPSRKRFKDVLAAVFEIRTIQRRMKTADPSKDDRTKGQVFDAACRVSVVTGEYIDIQS
ncbi:MAG: hypothetical protein EA377_03960 [Phycisphaerales bacterium]|nr:MAG: hypothetical protein EA377_03960 [Phycisphaerales bacterium]